MAGKKRKERKRILLIEPYYGGSHKHFLDGLQAHLGHAFRFSLLTLPARKWKMRMQTAAPWAANQIMELYRKGERFHGMVCSTFLDLAVLRSLLARAGVFLPAAVYFHENQFAYPGQVRDPGFFQFTNINWTTALCADRLAFNSHFNLDSFLAGISKFIAKITDASLTDSIASIQAKSTVLYPGIDFTAIDQACRENKDKARTDTRPVLVWNHRWEHDKNPETFFQALFDLDAAGIDFALIVLGQHFRDQPPVFARARKRLASHILHFGFVKNRAAYARLLCQGDIIVSTARHEFFGMAVLEAVRAGCKPLVPDRLAYVELYPEQYRYQPGKFTQALEQTLQNIRPSAQRPDYEYKKYKRYKKYSKLAAPHAWPALADRYHAWLTELCTIEQPGFLDNC
jgi:glycosyltransferase involved in cell wall biosynthesis